MWTKIKWNERCKKIAWLWWQMCSVLEAADVIYKDEFIAARRGENPSLNQRFHSCHKTVRLSDWPGQSGAESHFLWHRHEELDNWLLISPKDLDKYHYYYVLHFDKQQQQQAKGFSLLHLHVFENILRTHKIFLTHPGGPRWVNNPKLSFI